MTILRLWLFNHLNFSVFYFYRILELKSWNSWIKRKNIGKHFLISKYSLKNYLFFMHKKWKRKNYALKKNNIKTCIHKNLSYLFCQNLFLFPEKTIREIKISQKKIKGQSNIYPKFLLLFFLLFLVDRFVFYFKANWPWDDASVLSFFYQIFTIHP